MRGHGEIKVVAIPYRNFKEKIRLTKKYVDKYCIEDFGGILFMKIREGRK